MWHQRRAKWQLITAEPRLYRPQYTVRRAPLWSISTAPVASVTFWATQLPCHSQLNRIVVLAVLRSNCTAYSLTGVVDLAPLNMTTGLDLRTVVACERRSIIVLSLYSFWRGLDSAASPYPPTSCPPSFTVPVSYLPAHPRPPHPSIASSILPPRFPYIYVTLSVLCSFYLAPCLRALIIFAAYIAPSPDTFRRYHDRNPTLPLLFHPPARLP
ncbi:hypothetical protein B0H13DRAFT_2398574 [Mycena leptocephala]|nr:hypothetical protein B0H13DRAFT_2398574 [Mycena leptocephala]